MIAKFWTIRFTILLLIITVISKAQYVNINTNYTGAALVNELIGSNNSCLSVSNITVSGNNSSGISSYGYITSNGTTFEINKGILLTSGNAQNVIGSNTGIQSYSASSWNGDTDLENAANITNTTNASILEFDFVANTNKISFDYMFLSEQYLRVTDPGTCGYTDGFAFLLKKIGDPNYKNLALIPNTNIPITSNNIRGTGGKCPAQNPQYFGHYNPDFSPTSFNGQTSILTAESDVTPGATYHIKLVVADQGNGLYDSGVILKAGSFVGNKDLGPDRLISKGNPICENSTFLLDASIPGATYQWYKNGQPISGEISSTYNVTSPGFYEVEINTGTCNLRGSITIEYIDKVIANPKIFTNCDDDFDGNIPVNLQSLNNIIVSNNKPYFTIKYYQSQSDAIAGNANTLPNNWSYSTNTTIYIRVENSICNPEIVPIDFKFGNKITANDYSVQICDNDLNNSENINLNNYLSQITSVTGYSYAFYSSKSDANLEKNAISNNQNITANTTFFVRLKASGNCDNIVAININFGQPNKSTTLPSSITVCEGFTTILDAGFGFTKYAWSNGATTQTTTVGKGNYYVDLTTNNTCTYRQSVNVIESPKAIVDITKYNNNICDQNLDGVINVNLSDVTSAIILNPGIYTIKYYQLQSDAIAGNTNTLNNNWSYNNDKTIYVRVESNFCTPLIYPLDFKFGNKVPLISQNVPQTICDDNLDGEKTINLNDYNQFFTKDNNVSITYYNSENDAKNSSGAISNSEIVKNSRTFYLRFEKNGICSNWATLKINVQVPKSSSLLKNVEICKNATTILDAGTGFSSYRWNTGETTQSVTKGIGNYYVDLEFNGCTYRQNVKISAASEPIIDSIIELGQTITVNVSGGNPPYEYSLDQVHWQSSNFFDQLNRGIHSVYIRDSKKCSIKKEEFSIINLINVITPNGDGVNDVLDYSDLRLKKEVKIVIFDKYGKKIFSNENQNIYTWDGKENDRTITTDTYWYIIEWTEPDTNIRMNYKGWLLVKNRN